ncbi:MAG: aminoacyl-tRNA hydrolase [Actinomycetales bacterium]|nr:aminoacyl-tRNA hydrolase [Actinomycetales bacterium]
MSNDVWLVVGLGNPGPGYSGNRHNVGQMVLAVLADRLSAGFKAHKANASVAEARLGFGGPKLILAKPGSYMNTSGGPVSSLAKFYDVDPAHIIVIHDELDIPADDVRVKVGGGHAGHNGLRDIISALGTQEFVRVRVGIGRPPGRMEVSDFVLKDFSSTERKSLPVTLEIAADAIEAIALGGALAAQQKFNSPA